MEKTEQIYQCIGCWYDGASEDEQAQHVKATERLGISSDTPHAYHATDGCLLAHDDEGESK